MLPKNMRTDNLLLLTILLIFTSCQDESSTSANKSVLAPSNLTAVAISPRQVELTWKDNSDDETGFTIEKRKGSIEILEETKTVGANATQFRFVMLDPGTKYFFRMTSFGANSSSGFSNVAEITTPNNRGPWVELASDIEVNLFGVAITEEKTAFVCGEKGVILLTTNGGKEWRRPFSETENHLLDITFLNPQRGAAVGSTSSGGLTTITDTHSGGVVWQLRETNIRQDLRAIDFMDSETAIAVGLEGTILKTDDSGLNWRKLSSPTSTDLFALDFYDLKSGIVVGKRGIILKTENGGNSWETQLSPIAEDYYDVCFVEADSGIIVGGSGTILQTFDGGSIWTKNEVGFSEDFMGVSFISTKIGTIVGQNGIILKTIDGGTTWKAQNSATIKHFVRSIFLTQTLKWPLVITVQFFLRQRVADKISEIRMIGEGVFKFRPGCLFIAGFTA